MSDQIHTNPFSRFFMSSFTPCGQKGVHQTLVPHVILAQVLTSWEVCRIAKRPTLFTKSTRDLGVNRAGKLLYKIHIWKSLLKFWKWLCLLSIIEVRTYRDTSFVYTIYLLIQQYCKKIHFKTIMYIWITRKLTSYIDNHVNNLQFAIQSMASKLLSIGTSDCATCVM